MFNQIRSDFKRHDSSVLNPALWLILNYRFGNWVLSLRIKPLRWFLSKLYGFNSFLILITTGDILHRETKIGKNFHIIHPGNIKIHPRSVFGDNCGIQHGVTLGTNTEREGSPTIGNDVYIGTGAVIIGDIEVGDGARVAANSLVISNVPQNATAIGVPARMMKYSGRIPLNKKTTENSEKNNTIEQEE